MLNSISKKTFLLSLLIALIVVLVYLFLVIQPSNYRNWEFGQERLPKLTINNNSITINGLRDFHFEPNKIISTNYINRTVNVNDIEKVWFIIEPFGRFRGIAHTYLVFDFKDQDPIAISIEARREKNEEYSALLGTFNKYELIYIWGTESDETIRRVLIENNDLYMYPLNISNESSKKLFLQFAEETHNLETNPRFYNSLWSNCTNELAKVANKVKKGAIPLNLALFIPGYSAKELVKLGYLPTDVISNPQSNKYSITNFIKEDYDNPNFSKELRRYLENNK